MKTSLNHPAVALLQARQRAIYEERRAEILKDPRIQSPGMAFASMVLNPSDESEKLQEALAILCPTARPSRPDAIRRDTPFVPHKPRNLTPAEKRKAKRDRELALNMHGRTWEQIRKVVRESAPARKATQKAHEDRVAEKLLWLKFVDKHIKKTKKCKQHPSRAKSSQSARPTRRPKPASSPRAPRKAKANIKAAKCKAPSSRASKPSTRRNGRSPSKRASTRT